MDEELNEIKKYLYGNKGKEKNLRMKADGFDESANQWALQKAVMVDKRTQTLLLTEPISMQPSLYQMNMSIVPVWIREAFDFHISLMWSQSAFLQIPVD